MKASHACGATQDGWVMVERPDRMWCTGEGNGKPLQYSCLENPMLVLLLLLSCFSHVRFLRPHRRQPTRFPRPWDSLGKNTGVGCHFLLQCMKVKSESEAIQSCLTLTDPMNYSPPGSTVHGIFQARVLEWGAIAFSENPMNSMKRQNDRILKEELPRSVGAQNSTGDQGRNNSRKNEGMEPKQKQYPAVYVTGDRSKD